MLFDRTIKQFRSIYLMFTGFIVLSGTQCRITKSMVLTKVISEPELLYLDKKGLLVSLEMVPWIPVNRDS